MNYLYIAFAGEKYHCVGGAGDLHRVFTDHQEAIDWCKTKVAGFGFGGYQEWGQVVFASSGTDDLKVVWDSENEIGS